MNRELFYFYIKGLIFGQSYFVFLNRSKFEFERILKLSENKFYSS